MEDVKHKAEIFFNLKCLVVNISLDDLLRCLVGEHVSN